MGQVKTNVRQFDKVMVIDVESAILKRYRDMDFTKITSNNHYICIKKAYRENFLVLIKVNVKNRVDKTKR